MRLKGFKLFYEERTFSNFSRTLMNKLNINIGDAGGKVGSLPVAPGVIKLQVNEKPPWDDQWEDGVVKWYEVIEINDNSAKIKEVTGKCDDRGGNKQNVMAQCSTTSGAEFTITGKQLDWLMSHIAGQGNGGLGGGLGGMPPMGGGMPPAATPSAPAAGSLPPPTGAIK